MSTGWIIALSVIGGVLVVLLCLFMYCALSIAGKADKENDLSAYAAKDTKEDDRHDI